MATTVLLVDDHEMLREGLVNMIEASDGLELVGEASDGKQAVELVQTLRPEVTVMDVRLPLMSGIDATTEIVKRDPDAKVVILSAHERQSIVERSFRAGAMAYVAKSACSRELFEAIEAVCSGKAYLSPSVTPMVLDCFTSPHKKHTQGFAALTGRERDVLQRLADDMTNKEIAEELHISRRTVESHRASLMRKLGVHKTSGLVRIAIREELVAP